ncbi:TolC family protein [Desulfohalovibrio reitneri]|uniref:TolC family protein n=1 Tax=Desulfohalovibrio reitneri TaxID=1307759 RepID=UPI0005558C9C|nr:TolC family protein [Desulfohalovibrio reitneri]
MQQTLQQAALSCLALLLVLLACPAAAQDGMPLAEEHAEAQAETSTGIGGISPPGEEGETDGSFDLSRTVRRGLRLNPQISQARAQLSSRQYGSKSARSALGPDFTAGYAFEHQGREPTVANIPTGSQNRWTFTFNITQPIFQGFRLLSSYQRAALSEEQAQAQLDQAELQLIETVQTNFLDLLKARMDVKNSQDSVARLQSQLQVTSAFYDVGLRPKLDVLQAEVDLATAEQELLTDKNTVDTQMARLNTLIGLPLEKATAYDGELTYRPFQLSLTDCLARAYRQRPDLDIARKAVSIARKDVKIAASEFYPKLEGTYDYSQFGMTPAAQGDQVNETQYSEWSIGANARWTFFEMGENYFAYRETKEQVGALESELANTRLDASFEVKRNRLDLQEAADRISVARKSLEAAREGYRMAVARYQAQVGTNTDVLDAQERVSDAESQLSTALADYQKAMARLYVSMGERNFALNGQ